MTNGREGNEGELIQREWWSTKQMRVPDRWKRGEWAREPREARAGKRPWKGRGEADTARWRCQRRWYSGKRRAVLVPRTIATGGVGKQLLRSAGWERSDTIRSGGTPRGRRLLIEGHARHRLRVVRDNADTAGGVPRANAGSATNGYRKGAKYYSQGRSRLTQTAKRTLGAK